MSSAVPRRPSGPTEITPTIWLRGWSVHVSTSGLAHGSAATTPSVARSGHGAPAWSRDHSTNLPSTSVMRAVSTSYGSGGGTGLGSGAGGGGGVAAALGSAGLAATVL